MVSTGSICKEVAEGQALSEKTVNAVVKAFLGKVKEHVSAGETVTLKEFGSFSQVERAERQGHNPATGAKTTIPASKGVKWKASESFKKAL